MPSPGRLALAATCAGLFSSGRAFLPPTRTAPDPSVVPHASTALSMGRRRKPSMKERRRLRAKRQPGVKFNRADDSPPVEPREATESTAVATAPADRSEGGDANSEAAPPADRNDGDVDNEAEETAAKASSLVESQRRSVDVLSFVRRRVEEAFPVADAAKSIVEKGYAVHDNFLSSDEDEEFGDALLSEMFKEGPDMLSNDKLERDIARLGDGEFVGRIVGGEKYAECPRLTEYVVSLTRHLPPLLNKEMDALAAGTIPRLDSTASIGTMRLYDRKARRGAETLLRNPGTSGDAERPFGVVCEDSEGTAAENDSRRLTAMLFLSSEAWDPSTCGGGVTVEGGERVGAIRDRLVLLRSDTCSHRQEPWTGEDKAGLEQASCVIVHFVKDTTNGS